MSSCESTALHLVAQFPGSPHVIAGTLLECVLSIHSLASAVTSTFNVTGIVGHVVGQFKLDEKTLARMKLSISSLKSPLGEIGTPASPMYFDASCVLSSALNANTSLLYSAPVNIRINDADKLSARPSYHMSLQLPEGLPPSIRGSIFKVAYKLLVAVQVEFCEPSESQSTTLLQIPFRVLPASLVHLSQRRCHPVSPAPVGKPNPFWLLSPGETGDSRRQSTLGRSAFTAGAVRTALLAATDSTASPDPLSRPGDAGGLGCTACRPNWINRWIESTAAHPNASASVANFNISSQYGRVARFCLIRTAFRLGDLIRGYFDFTESSVTCLKCTLSLQSEESCYQRPDASPLMLPRSARDRIENPVFIVHPFKPNDDSNTETNKEFLPHVCTHQDQEYICLSHQFLPFSLPIPTNISPQFRAHCQAVPDLVVDYRWQLRLTFDLVPYTAAVDLTGSSAPGQAWRLPSDIPVERLTWTLPIQLTSFNPSLLSTPSCSLFTHPIAVPATSS